MDTIGSIVTIALVLAAIFVPQALLILLSESKQTSGEAYEEYVPDGR